METQPGGEGISVLDTDLEVDFAAPVGYVEPERPKPLPVSTMASKLNIDLNSSTPGSSRPTSALAGTFASAGRAPVVSKGGDQWESFKGKGETLGGRKTKGKGISHRQAEDVSDSSKIFRTEYVFLFNRIRTVVAHLFSSKHRVVDTNSLEGFAEAPAPLNLPFGKLFFGFTYTPFTPPDKAGEKPNSPVRYSFCPLSRCSPSSSAAHNIRWVRQHSPGWIQAIKC